MQQWLDHLLPKKLKPVGRLLVLPPNLWVACVRLRLDARLERLVEHLRPFERLDDRDDGMPYTYELETKMVQKGFCADRETIRQMCSAACQGVFTIFPSCCTAIWRTYVRCRTPP